ncbi:hypothetical protein CGZ80_06780 [Rhodopirellula sp. MGV]|nr:hypothetical protein CGZ80_06780 [Rhodopirellula sp. MGV]
MATSNNTLPNPDDADPMIDALLVEFISGDPSRRREPPDLSAAILERLAADSSNRQPPLPKPANGRRRLDVDGRPLAPPVHSGSSVTVTPDKDHAQGEVADESDLVVDSLLKEFISVDPGKRSCPPDLTAAILSQLKQPLVTTPVTRARRERLSLIKTLSAIVAISACVAGVVFLGPSATKPPNPTQNTSAPLAAITKPVPEENVAVASPQQQSPSLDPKPDDRPLKGIRLDPEPSPGPSAVADAEPPSSSNTIASTENVVVGHIERIATTTESIAREYWKSIGVQPTQRAPNQDLIARIERQLGVKLSEEAFSDPQQMRLELASPNHTQQIAKRWLALSADWGVAAVDTDENQALIQELSQGFSGDRPIDTTLVSLISGKSEHSGAWYQTIGRNGSEGIARRLASLSMNADLRCVRCHDSMIGRNGTQDDYWSFVAMVRSYVHRDNDRWTVRDESHPVPTFFELIDGRQRLATPNASEHLTGQVAIDDFQAWTQTLRGSQQLSSSLVDSLWKLVHGRPLQPSPVDAFAPPIDDSLNELHRALADDLRASGFDLARTLSLIISSPMATRSVPQELQSETILTTSNDVRSRALDLVTAYAAAVDSPPSSRGDRIEVAMQHSGGRLLDDGTLLAQPLLISPTSRDVSANRKPSLSRSDRISIDYPGDDSEMPVSWIHSIDDFDQKVEHLVYLAGGSQTPERINEVAKQLRENGTEAAALSRIWWILR